MPEVRVKSEGHVPAIFVVNAMIPIPNSVMERTKVSGGRGLVCCSRLTN